MRHIKSIAIAIMLAAVINSGKATAAVNDAEGGLMGWTPQAMFKNPSLPLNGGYSYRSNGFNNSGTYWMQSPAESALVFTGAEFKHQVSQSVGGGSATWTVSVVFVDVTTNTEVLTLYTASGTGTPGAYTDADVYMPNPVDLLAIIDNSHLFALRFKGSTTSGNTNTVNNWVKFDDLDVKTGVLSLPSYDYPDMDLSFANGMYRVADSTVYGDLFIEKGVQTGTLPPFSQWVQLSCKRLEKSSGLPVDTAFEYYEIANSAGASSTNTGLHKLEDTAYEYVYSVTYLDDSNADVTTSQPALWSVIPWKVRLTATSAASAGTGCLLSYGFGGTKYAVITPTTYTVYSDIFKTAAYNGNNRYYKASVDGSSLNAAIKVNGSGLVTDYAVCP